MSSYSKYITIGLFWTASIALFGCESNKQLHDASGTFEAVKTIVPAQANGIVEELNLIEGSILDSLQYVGYIDSTALVLNREVLYAQIASIESKFPDPAVQLAPLQSQLAEALKDQKRLERLVQAQASTQKQLDDINTQVKVLQNQIEAQKSSLTITISGMKSDIISLEAQINQLNDQIKKCTIYNPVSGTVLTKYTQAKEMAAPGKALYEIADLTAIDLRAYVTASQLSQIKLGQELQIFVDQTTGSPDKVYKGHITWISSQAEFTPKTILTKPEREDLVYAVKIRVKNDGYLKLGMYAEVKF